MSDDLLVELAEAKAKNELLRMELEDAATLLDATTQRVNRLVDALAEARENSLSLYRASADAQSLQDAYEEGLYVGNDALELSQAETKAAKARVDTLEMRIRAAQEALQPPIGAVVNRMRPNHPGEIFLYEWVIAQSGSELSTWAENLRWPYEKLRSFVNEEIHLDDVMAAELSAVTGTTKAFWINLQESCDTKGAMTNELLPLIDDTDDEVTKNEICPWYPLIEKRILALVPEGFQAAVNTIVDKFVEDPSGHGTSRARSVILGLLEEGRISLSDDGKVLRRTF